MAGPKAAIAACGNSGDAACVPWGAALWLLGVLRAAWLAPDVVSYSHPKSVFSHEGVSENSGA